MPRIPNGLGRAVFIALLAGAMFAGFLMVTPRLTAASRDVQSDPSDTTAITTTTTAPVSTTTSMPRATTTTAAPIALLPEDGFDGTVALTIEVQTAGHGKNEIFDGDHIRWRFHVANPSEETLWGVFVYLELHGPALCTEHILEPGESTDCWLTTRAAEGAHVAEAWVNAWTLTEMVRDKVFTDLVVLP